MICAVAPRAARSAGAGAAAYDLAAPLDFGLATVPAAGGTSQGVIVTDGSPGVYRHRGQLGVDMHRDYAS